jgi:hypothetical protein
MNRFAFWIAGLLQRQHQRPVLFSSMVAALEPDGFPAEVERRSKELFEGGLGFFGRAAARAA